MGAQRPRPLILDAGALIAVERGDRRVVRLLELAGPVHVPTAVVAQVWRNPARQVRLVRVLRSDAVDVVPLDEPESHAVGQLCAASETSDVVDASVALLTRRLGGVAVTSDPHDLRRIDPGSTSPSCEPTRRAATTDPQAGTAPAPAPLSTAATLARMSTVRQPVTLLAPEEETVAEHSEHLRLVDMVHAGLAARYAGAAEVAVHCRLAWFPDRGNTRIRLDPDVMVVFGRPQEARSSYRTWDEGDTPPTVLIEVWSDHETDADYRRRLTRARRYGAEEVVLVAPFAPGGVRVEHLVADASDPGRFRTRAVSTSHDVAVVVERLGITLRGGDDLVVTDERGVWPDTATAAQKAAAADREAARADQAQARATRRGPRGRGAGARGTIGRPAPSCRSGSRRPRGSERNGGPVGRTPTVTATSGRRALRARRAWTPGCAAVAARQRPAVRGSRARTAASARPPPSAPGARAP